MVAPPRSDIIFAQILGLGIYPHFGRYAAFFDLFTVLNDKLYKTQ